MTAPIDPIYPYYGGKRRIAQTVWRAFGDPANYVEPFFGSGAVLLARPHEPRIETINDLDHNVANVFRSIAADPDAVARWCDHPVTEVDVNARHQWLVDSVEFRERMHTDPDHYDVKRAGYWLYGICAWIGQGWCARDPGTKVNRQLPHLGNAGRGIHRPDNDTFGQLRQIAARLRRVRVACGDWTRVMGESVTTQHGTTAIFCDPPYDDGAVDYAAGARGVASDVAAWCREHGDDKRYRIAICGYAGDHDLPGWTVHAWKAHGGYGSQRKTDEPNMNAHRERIWFSPGCLPVTTHSLLDLLEG